MDEDELGNLIRRAVEDEQISIQEVYSKGLNHGMERAIQIYENKQFDIPEIIVCADTLNKGLDLLNAYGPLHKNNKGTVLLAVVEGDTHEIGKNIVKIMIKAAGYEVKDMGVNQNVDEIIRFAMENKVQIIGLSSMMTTTRGEMKKLIDQIHSLNATDIPAIIVGGGSVTNKYAKEINADGYAANAPNTVKLIQSLLSEGEKN